MSVKKKRISKYLVVVYIFTLGIICFSSCSKLISIPEPVDTITTSETFANAANANSAISAIYSNMSWPNNAFRYANGAITIYSGLLSDELMEFGNPENLFATNNLMSNNTDINNMFWKPAYSHIYMANAAIEGLRASNTLSDDVKNQLEGEAMFLRAFSYFYLVNLFGDIPLITSTDFAKNSLLPRSSSSEIYKQIVEDLRSAASMLPSDYSLSNEQRTRAGKWAATALLARAYLYTRDWKNAEATASEVITSTGNFSLQEDLNKVFKNTSNETILQLETIDVPPYGTYEGKNLVPAEGNSPNYILSNLLLQSFEPDDKRRVDWVDSTNIEGTVYYYPYKYKENKGIAGQLDEYYILLRLSEQYLIRAEARAKQNNLNGAIGDLNIIRHRAGLSDLQPDLNQDQVFSAIAQENRTEFFSEWGHRWFDLKRTDQARIILKSIKGDNWQDADQLMPIPLSELQKDPNLVQNPNY
jgi:hypothetical protein